MLISGILLLRDMISEPPGKISSVDMLSPSLSKTSPVNLFGVGLNVGKGLMLGPIMILADVFLSG